MELDSQPCWQVLLKLLSRMHKGLDSELWSAPSWEKVVFLKGQKRTLDVVEKLPEEIRTLVKQLRGQDNV
jgi:hypothetical protein